MLMGFFFSAIYWSKLNTDLSEEFELEFWTFHNESINDDY